VIAATSCPCRGAARVPRCCPLHAKSTERRENRRRGTRGRIGAGMGRREASPWIWDLQVAQAKGQAPRPVCGARLRESRLDGGVDLQDRDERHRGKGRGGSEPRGRGRQRRRGMAVTQAARRSCPWVGMMLEVLKVSRGAHPQQQHSYLEQRRRRMIMHCSARAFGHAGAGGTYQEAGSTTSARVPAIRAAHGPPEGSQWTAWRRPHTPTKAVAPTLTPSPPRRFGARSVHAPTDRPSLAQAP